jgi:outer membrane protein W
MKKYIFLTLLIIASMSSQAQDTIETAVIKEIAYKPTKKQFTVGINLGRGTFISGGSAMSFNNTVSGQPTYNSVDLNSNSAMNMIGAEVRYFLSSKWALSLSGGLAFSNTPASINIPAVGTLPAYDAVVEDIRLDISYSVGALYFFDYKKNNRLMPYLGFLVPVNHSNRSTFNPTVDANGTPNLGAATVEVSGVGLQAVAGVDYFLTENIYFGLSIKPMSFMFINNTRYPAPGLFSRKVSNTSMSSFVQPLLRIGFKL